MKLRNIFFLISYFFLTSSVTVAAQGNEKFIAGKVKDIQPKGWLFTLMQRQQNGLTGHPEALSYPYNSCLWAGEISRSGEAYGENWWRYEQTAYYTDGLLRLGYEMDDEAMIAKAMEGIEYTLSHPSESGVLGNSSLKGITWPMSVFFRVLQAKYEHDGDQRIPQALEKHYLNFSADDLAGGIVGGRNIMSIEGILWTYGKTGNEKLLQLAEEAWARENCFAVDEASILSDEHFYMHSVTFCEMLKLPLLLYQYTGKEHYLELAMTAIRKVERESMLPDGVPSSAEFLLGNDIDISHETCDIVDFTWTLSHYMAVTGETEWADKIEKAIFNAGLGCITKDFRSLQYFSSLNQFIATGTSNHNIYKHGSTWMAYRPTHETECCSGNINRMLPNMVSRMWMTDKQGGAVAAIYAPSTATFPTDNGSINIYTETNYPFDETLNFHISGTEGESIPFTFKIPTWCNNASVSINGKSINLLLMPGTYVTLPDNVKNGDLVTLVLPMEVNKTKLEGQGVFFNRGPLLFSYAIPQTKTEDKEVYENMHGKKPENEDFKCWSITPQGNFNFAFADNGQELTAIENANANEGSFPFDINDTPVKIKIPVKHIKWELEENRYTPELPEQGHLQFIDNNTEYITLVPYGCTELRLTVFPDADAEPLPEKPKPDYSRPDNAPACVEQLDDCYYAYFEKPQFCWDSPIYCKVKAPSDTATDIKSSKGSELCTKVGYTDSGNEIWRWVSSDISKEMPNEIIFTNNDLLTFVMTFQNSGYYNYDHLIYLADKTQADGIKERPANKTNIIYYDLQGRKIGANRPTAKGIYINSGKKVSVR